MRMKNKIIIYNSIIYKEILLSGNKEKHLVVGTGNDAYLRFPSDEIKYDFNVEFINDGYSWVIKCSDNICIINEAKERIRDYKIEIGEKIKIVKMTNGEEIFTCYFVHHFENQNEDYNKRIDCRQINTFRVGTSSNSTIQILSDSSINTELVMTKNGKGFRCDISNCEENVFLNGNPVRKNSIDILNHDFLSLGEFNFYYCDGWFYVSEKLPLNTGLFSEVLHMSKNHLMYPTFIRSVRQMYEIPAEKIDILPPKSYTPGTNRNLAMSILPILLSMMFMLIMRFFMGRSAIFAIYSIGMMLVSILMAIWNYKYQDKQHSNNMRNRVERYSNYISISEEKIEKLRNKEQRIARQKTPSLEEQMSFVDNFDARLFERRPEDDDFLSCYLGTGTLEADNQIEYKKQEYVDIDDPLMDYPEMLHNKYKYTSEMPIILKLKENSALGFVGVRNKLYQMLKNLILTLGISHYFNDVKFCLFIDYEDVQYFEWCRWLQNFTNEYTNKRNIACDEKSTRQLLEFLYAELSGRENNKQVNHNFEVHYVIFVYRSEMVCKHPINTFFSKAKDLGVTFVFWEEYPEFLVKDCEMRVFLSGEEYSGYIQDAKNGENIQRFTYSRVPMKDAEKAALKMSCVYVEETNLESKLTKNISLFELLDITSVTQLDLKRRWDNSKIYESMAAPLGVKSGDEIVYLDIHEKNHGPHGLVAGTTGSGKSEILQSYILSMSTLFHPHEVGFIIIDFKGGGMANQFKKLPHLNGVITNIDGKQINRSLMSIRAELLKRQELFAEYEVNHIDDYIKAYKSGKAKKPLPHLILIVDEFAELKSEQPEFMKELISTARIGRSLGVHLILATQKPAGVVNDQIWSNSNFRLCLRVQNKEDSNEVLKSPLAAEIREPGRAYLQVGNNEIFLLFQSGYSGAGIPKDELGCKEDFNICMVDVCGNRVPIYEQQKKENDTQITQLDAMVDYIELFCNENNIDKLPDICLQPLSERIIYSADNYKGKNADICIPFGYYDDPSRQLQEITELNFTQNNVVILGASQSGKTNLLQVILKAIADLYTPEDVTVYIWDFASMVLKRFEKMAHIGSVITLRDDDTMKSFIKMIMEELESRKDRLSEEGYSSYSVYLESGKKEMPQIILLLDNLMAFKELFPQYEDVFMRLCREGNAVGIAIVVTSVQTNAVGFRMLANFGKRIALYSNDSSSYGYLFDRCRIKPDNLPGRFLTEIDKEVYEGQSFVAFEAEKESDKLAEIDNFISEVNKKYKEKKVTKFESLPNIVTTDYINERVDCLPGEMVVGIDYLSVGAKKINILEHNIWGILEKEHSGSTNFMNYIVQTLFNNRKNQPVRIDIVDHINRKLDIWQEYQEVINYSYNPVKVIDYVTEISTILQERYQDMVSGNESGQEQELLVLLINSAEAYNILGGNLKVQDMYSKIVTLYKGLGVFIILGKLPNANLNFGMPPIIKIVRDEMNIFSFQNINEQRLVDVPAAIVREYAKKLETGDAYLIEGTNLSKIKTPLWENKI